MMSENKNNEHFSVFDDPSTETPFKKKPSKTVILISLLCVTAVLAGVFIAVKKIKPQSEDTNSLTSLFDTVKIVDISKDTIAEVTVTNENGTFEFKPFEETVENENTSSSYKVTKWYVSDNQNEKTNTNVTESIVSAAATVSVMREITEKSAKDCGLETPVCKVEVKTADNRGYTILIGNSSPDGYGVYLKTENKDTVYLADSSVLESFEFSLADLLDI
ncbi:MAG: DUF4340 domain-containing protein [Clostridia bacterium]|nr:DUF4340 domain-containing protein [Clostridia bacterium]